MASREERTEALATNLNIYVSEAHIFTSDAIALASFCAPRHKDKCCDLGTGNGIIPLLWLRDFKPAEIVGVELADSAVTLLNKTLKENNIEDKIRPVHCDLRRLKGEQDKNRRTYRIERRRLKNRSFAADILAKYGITAVELSELLRK